MSVIALTSTLAVGAGSGMGQRRYDVGSLSDSNGSFQARLLGPPRWTMSLRSPDSMTPTQASEWMSIALRLRGRVNVLSAWDTARPVPRGTLGTGATLTLSGTHSLGATTLTVTGGGGQAGKTLLAGDWLQVGTGLGTSQLVMVMTSATANGSGVFTLTTEPPLRAQYASSTAVAWNKPLAYFRMMTESVTWTWSGPRSTQGMALDLLETWTS